MIPNANLSYTIQPESFALMNAMEFVNDQYLSWDVTYWINGAILNRIPLLKKLKMWCRSVDCGANSPTRTTRRSTPSCCNFPPMPCARGWASGPTWR